VHFVIFKKKKRKEKKRKEKIIIKKKKERKTSLNSLELPSHLQSPSTQKIQKLSI
jgi:hypothetical protein